MTTRNLPSSDLEEAIRRMALLEGVSPSAGQGLRAKQLQNAALASLKDARQVLRADAEGGSEIRAASAKPLSAIRYQGDEPTPGGYEESVDAYFRALAEPDNGE